MARIIGDTDLTNDTSAGSVLTSAGVGTVAGATVVAEEHGDLKNHYTILTLTAFDMGLSGDNASLGIGNKFYTLPAGDFIVESAMIKGALTADVDNTAQTPEVGIGSTIGVGAVANLATTMEDVVDGGAAGIIGGALVAPDLAGTAFYKGILATSAQGVLFKASGGKSHDLFLNAAVAWANVAAAANVFFTGSIILKWSKLT